MSNAVKVLAALTLFVVGGHPVMAQSLNEMLRSPMNAPAVSQPAQTGPSFAPPQPYGAQPSAQQPLPFNGGWGGGRPLSKDQMRQLATDATVFIAIFEKQKSGDVDYAGSGSGFFIGPDLILTNSHVASDADGLLVSINGSGYAVAKVVSNSFVKKTKRADFAVLKIAKPAGIQPLTFGAPVQTLTTVYSVGFPGTVIRTGAKQQAFLQGDLSAVPEVVISTGAVQSVMEKNNGLEVITHSALISQGNSGGPLLNACGQVVGINTWTTVEAADIYTADGQAVNEKGKGAVAIVNSGFSVAQSVDEITRFLKSRHTPFQVGPTCQE